MMLITLWVLEDYWKVEYINEITYAKLEVKNDKKRN